MNQKGLSVREIEFGDIDLIVNYWLNSDRYFLKKMGVDLNKLPSEIALTEMLAGQIKMPVAEKEIILYHLVI